MSETQKTETGPLAGAAHVAAVSALPDAPLAMPVQSLDRPAPLAILRVILGISNRVVRH
jgi:hypothetical protein